LIVGHIKIRNVKKVVTGKRAVDGAGVRLVRVIQHEDSLGNKGRIK